MDHITLKRIALMHPSLREEVMKMYTEMCAALTGKATVRFAYTLRTFAEQDALYAQGRTVLFDKAGKRLGKVTNAKGGESLHNYGLAFDIVLLTDDGKAASWDTKKDFDGDKKPDWMECVEIAKKYGFEWGGDWENFVDMPHFQKTFGFITRQLLAKKNTGEVDKEGYVILN